MCTRPPLPTPKFTKDTKNPDIFFEPSLLEKPLTTPGMSRDPLGDLLLLRDFKLDELLSLLNIASELFSLLIIIAPEEADFSLLITSLLFAGLADFLLLLFDLPERSKCSDLDLGMAELMQSANRSSSSCPVLSRLSIERSEREELKLLFAFFASNDFGARPAVSDAPVEDPELPDLGKRDFILNILNILNICQIWGKETLF